ncbi:tetratricopeptide repeat protein [Streptomyces sp. NPDC001137]|uniref:tetratricopeptide repeat protein n=1 Tax=Streptomyces sp. NPDC001137 TaxID=3154378 RepID=UPI00332A8D63
MGYVADGGQVAYHAAPRPAVTWPHQVGVLPRQADSLQDRAAAAQLEQTPMAQPGGATMAGQVLAGLGGVGKTQLAARHARTLWRAGAVDLLVWITASTRAAIVDAYTQAAAEILDADPAAPEHAARAFLAWLEPKPGPFSRRWLVVLDDLADPADLRGLWPPASPHGHTLITTRRREAALTGSGRTLIEVGVFTPGEAIAYLTTALATHGRTECEDELAALADELGRLPLALSQAVAYLIDTGLDSATYRARLADQQRILTELLPDPSGLPDDHDAPVAATWALSVQRADQLVPAGLARPMLELLAMLDPNGIPGPLLAGPPALAYLTDHRNHAAGRADARSVPADEALRALRVLHRLSLIEHAPQSVPAAVRIHRLVQRTTRDTLTPERRERLVRATADALVQAWPDIEHDTALAQALRANSDALAAHSAPTLWQSGNHGVLYRAALSLGQAGQLHAAAHRWQDLHTAAQHYLGRNHPATFRARHRLAHWQGEAGDAAGAVAAFAELLADEERVLGSEHPHTLAVRNQLAYWRGRAGDAAGAVAAFAKLLEDRVRVSGRDHPDTLTARHNLAYWRGAAGDAAGAVAAFAELLADEERVLGPEHPHTLSARHQLAQWQEAVDGVPADAADLSALLATQQTVLGHHHPDTLATRHRLADQQGVAGDAAGAAAAFADLLDDRVRALGCDHPDTLTARHQLAYWQGAAGDVSASTHTFGELLEDRIRILGPDHPDTLATRHNLLYWLGESVLAGADMDLDITMSVADAFAELLADEERVLGPDHPQALDTAHHLASLRLSAEERQQAGGQVAT